MDRRDLFRMCSLNQESDRRSPDPARIRVHYYVSHRERSMRYSSVRSPRTKHIITGTRAPATGGEKKAILPCPSAPKGKVASRANEDASARESEWDGSLGGSQISQFCTGPEFTLSAARSTRATNLWAGSSNKTYVEHDSPVRFCAGVKLIKQSRTNYLLDISGDVNPAAQFSVEAYCVSPHTPRPILSLRPTSRSQSPAAFVLPLAAILCRSPDLRAWDYSNVVLSRVIRGNTFKLSISVPIFHCVFNFYCHGETRWRVRARNRASAREKQRASVRER